MTGPTTAGDPRETHDWDRLAADMAALGLNVMREHDLGGYTTYGVGGPARVAVRIEGDKDIESLAAVTATHRGLGCLVVGRGSNLLVCDKGFDGVAILAGSAGSAGGHDELVLDGGSVLAGAAMPMPVLARRASSMGCGGLEWAVGIPGTVGGAVRMNAGCHGSDMSEATVSADVISLVSGRRVCIAGGDLGYHFRGSVLADHHVVVSVRMGTRPCDPETSAAELARIVAWRRENQPGGKNAGSVFVNPGDGSRAAGSMIDECRLKGARRGGAEVSAKHANFIQVHEGATAADVVALMEHVQDVVEKVHGVKLRSEIRLVGFPIETAQRFADDRHSLPEWQRRARRLRVLLGEESA